MIRLKKSVLKRLQFCIDQHLDLKYEDSEKSDKYASEAIDLAHDLSAGGVRYIKLDSGWLNTKTLNFERSPDRASYKTQLF